MGWTSFNEDLIERITDSIQALAEDVSPCSHGISIPEETRAKRIAAISGSVDKIKNALDPYMDLVTDPKLDLARENIILNRKIVVLSDRLNSADVKVKNLENKLLGIKAAREQDKSIISQLRQANEKLTMEVGYYKTPKKSMKYSR